MTKNNVHLLILTEVGSVCTGVLGAEGGERGEPPLMDLYTDSPMNVIVSQWWPTQVSHVKVSDHISPRLVSIDYLT